MTHFEIWRARNEVGSYGRCVWLLLNIQASSNLWKGDSKSYRSPFGQRNLEITQRLHRPGCAVLRLPAQKSVKKTLWWGLMVGVVIVPLPCLSFSVPGGNVIRDGLPCACLFVFFFFTTTQFKLTATCVPLSCLEVRPYIAHCSNY